MVVNAPLASMLYFVKDGNIAVTHITDIIKNIPSVIQMNIFGILRFLNKYTKTSITAIPQYAAQYRW